MKVIVIPCLFDNYAYLLCDEKSNAAAVVDPSEARPVIRAVEAQGASLTTVLCTHHHHDHIGGIDELRREFDGLEVVGFHQDRARIPQLTKTLEDGESLEVSGVSGRVIHTPGHTSGSVVYLLGGHLFVGDTLFGAGCGRLFEGTPEQMVASLERIVSQADPDDKIYFGHEYTALNLRFAAQVDPENQDVSARSRTVASARERSEPTAPSTLQEELQTNPFLRYKEPALARSLEREGVLKNPEPLDVFTALREKRNHFS